MAWPGIGRFRTPLDAFGRLFKKAGGQDFGVTTAFYRLLPPSTAFREGQRSKTEVAEKVCGFLPKAATGRIVRISGANSSQSLAMARNGSQWLASDFAVRILNKRTG